MRGRDHLLSLFNSKDVVEIENRGQRTEGRGILTSDFTYDSGKVFTWNW